jgi:hypothetical protein
METVRGEKNNAKRIRNFDRDLSGFHKVRCMMILVRKY